MFEKKHLVIGIAVSILLGWVAACAPMSPPPQPATPTLSTGAEQVKGRAAAQDESPSLPVATLTVVGPQTYRDPDLGFELRYGTSWHVDTRSGTALNDGSGRTIILEKDGYQFKMMIQNKPHIVGACAGLLPQDTLMAYWKYTVGDLELWRARAETGFVNSYSDNQRSFIDIISPTSWYQTPTHDGAIGEYTCSLETKGKMMSVSYLLPVSADDLKAGRFRADILAEMDYILTSLSMERSQQLRVVNSGREDIRNLTVLFPGPTADAPATRVEFGDVLAGETTRYQDVPSGVYRYAAYVYTLDSREVNQPVIDWVGENPLEGEKFTYRIELDPEKKPGGQIQLLEVLVGSTTSPAQAAAGVKPSVTSTPTRRPTATATATEVAETPTATPDIAGTLTAAIQPRLYGSYPSPDHKWQAEVLIYDCTQVVGEEKNSYEQLKLIHLEDGAEKIADSQLQYCGGLGAYGLAGLFWSPNSRYFYYTTAREGGPDGCGYWERPLTRLDVTNLKTEYLGGGLRSPDGTKIAAWHDRDLAVWDINGDEIGRAAAAVTTAEIGPIAWSPNSQSLVYAQIESYCPFSGKSYIVRLDLPELKSTVLIESERPSLGSPVWETSSQIRLFDENGKEWRYSFATKKVTSAP